MVDMEAVANGNEKLIKVSDILQILKSANVSVGRSTFDRWVTNGYFPESDIKVGRYIRWKMSTFKAWLQKCIDDAKR